MQLTLWLVSAVVYATANGIIAPRLITRVGFTIVLVGLSTSAIAFLTTERLLRPVAARVLAAGEVDRTGSRGSPPATSWRGPSGPRCRCSGW